MSRIQLTPTLSAIAAGALFLGAPPAQAQDVKVNALVDVWYNQILDSNLRTNSQITTPGASKYYSLNSAFQENGFATAGNSSSISDGAAAAVIMSREKAIELGCNIMGTIGAQASSGIDMKDFRAGRGRRQAARAGVGKQV